MFGSSYLGEMVAYFWRRVILKRLFL